LVDEVAGFMGFARHVMALSGKAPARHHELLIARLQAVANGDCDRLIVQMPPGAAKSTYGSVLFPAYFFGRQQGRQIIATAHTASLAMHFGRQVRQVLVEHAGWLGAEIAKESRGAGRFSLADGGEYFAAGVRGPITGRRADLILIDDPIKSWADAESQVARDALYDWYRAELTARLKPGGRIVLMMTRWHEDDLAGRLLAAEGGWTCLSLPALAVAGDAMGRDVGQALWPEWQDAAAIARRRSEVGERAFAAMYQQMPRPPEATLFDVRKIEVVVELPVLARTVRAWDLAASLVQAGRNPDYTVGLKLGLTDRQTLIVLDVVRLQASAAQVESKILAVAKADGVTTLLALPQDPGQAGAAQIGMLTRSLLGFQVVASPERGAKVNRAMPAATQVDAGNFAILAGPWNEAFLAELRAFPESQKDDQVDALSRAVNTMATHFGAPARRMNVALFGR
jgi:predicted phage terminase large subunit-like protein